MLTHRWRRTEKPEGSGVSDFEEILFISIIMSSAPLFLPWQYLFLGVFYQVLSLRR